MPATERLEWPVQFEGPGTFMHKPSTTQLLFLGVQLAFSWLSAHTAEARPEYAGREKVSCTSCHETPWGGGPRNVTGKSYGTRGEEGSKTVGTDLYYGDLRAVAYWPFKAVSQSNSGLAEMEAALSGNIPVIEQEGGSEVRTVVTYQLSPLAGNQLRDGYVRYSPSIESATPSFWTIGHFYVPFGLMTDEHRTYTRIQTNSSMNDYDTGVAFSHDFEHDLHFDVAVVNDFQTQGSFSNGKITAGTVGNVRWNPKAVPLLLGGSVNWERISTAPEPYAFSLYGVVNLDKFNHGKMTGSFLFESVYAKNWNNPAVSSGGVNPSLPTFFSVNYGQAPNLLTSPSFGNSATLKWDVTKMWQLFYKLDALSLDATHMSHLYTRSGFGVEKRLNANMILNTRFEYATYPDAQSSLPPFEAKESDFFAMLRLWF